MDYKIIMYTDGAASGNPGPGGYGVVLMSGGHRKELSQGYRLTTNNRMELMAVIAGLEALKTDDCDVTIYTDSKYVSEPVNQGWLFKWEKERFKKRKNPDLWQRFLPLYRKHRIKMIWIKGHNNNKENERCDYLAVKAGQSSNLPDDSGYVNDLGSELKELDF